VVVGGSKQKGVRKESLTPLTKTRTPSPLFATIEKPEVAEEELLHAQLERDGFGVKLRLERNNNPTRQRRAKRKNRHEASTIDKT